MSCCTSQHLYIALFDSDFNLLLGDELFSDSFPVQLIDGVVYKVKGKVGDAVFLRFCLPRRHTKTSQIPECSY